MKTDAGYDPSASQALMSGDIDGAAGRGPGIGMQYRMNDARFDMDVKQVSNFETGTRSIEPLPVGPGGSWVVGGQGAFAGSQRRFVGASGALHGMWLQDLRATK